MAYTRHQLRNYIHELLLEQLEERFTISYGPDWKHGWVENTINPDWLADDDDLEAINSNRVEYVPWNQFLPQSSAAQQVRDKYIDVEILSVTREQTRAPGTGLVRWYWVVVINVLPDSPFYWKSSNVRQFEFHESIEKLYDTYSVENHYDLLQIIYKEDFNILQKDKYWIVRVRLLPGHEAYNYKWDVSFPNKWATDYIIPDTPIQLEDDVALENYLKDNIPSADMRQTLFAFAEAMSYQLLDVVNGPSFDLMPLYVDNSSSAAWLQIFTTNQKKKTDLSLPIVHSEIENLKKSPYSLGLFFNQWSFDWYKTPLLGSSKKRREFFNELMIAASKWKGIFSVKEDKYDFYPPSDRTTIYNIVGAPHKFEWLTHLFNEELVLTRNNREDLLIRHPGNTHNTLKYPINDVKTVEIVGIYPKNLKKLSYCQPSKFKISDRLNHLTSTTGGKTAFVTDVIPKLYKDDPLAELYSVKVCFIEDRLFFPCKVLESKGILTIEVVGPDPNFDLEVGESLSFFNDYTVEEFDLPVKTIVIKDTLSITYRDNLGISVGDTIYPITAIDNKNIEILDIDDTLVPTSIGTAQVVKWWATSIPGELNEPVIDNKTINFNRSNDIEYWDGIRDTQAYYGENASWISDILDVLQSTLHTILNSFIVEGSLVINTVDVMSEFDDDWGIITDTVFQLAAEAPVARVAGGTAASDLFIVPPGVFVVPRTYIDGGRPDTVVFEDGVDDGYPDSPASDIIYGGRP